MSTIIINGQVISNFSSKGSVSIVNGKVTIDGKEVTDLATYKGPNVSIVIQGEVGNVSLDNGTLEINGNAQSVKTMSGDATIRGNVMGNVSTMSGDVNAGPVQGSVSTMSGDITHQ